MWAASDHNKKNKKTSAGNSDWLPLAALVVIGLLTLSAHLLEYGKQDEGQALVTAVFPPWWSPDRACLAASSAGVIAAVGQYHFVFSVLGDKADVSKRLREFGAIIILDGRSFLLCGSRGTIAR